MANIIIVTTEIIIEIVNEEIGPATIVVVESASGIISLV